jgi:replicative DNA helicase
MDRHPNAPGNDIELLQLKVPPHSREAEQSLLGALLLDNQAFERVADLVTADDFYQDDHRRIWRHISKLIEANRPADTLTVNESMEASEDRGKYGGAAYIGALAQNTPSAINARRYAELVRERSLQRNLATIGTQLAERAMNGAETPLEIAEEAAAALMKVQAGADRGGVSEFGAAMVEAVEWADNPKRGLATGTLPRRRRRR